MFNPIDFYLKHDIINGKYILIEKMRFRIYSCDDEKFMKKLLFEIQTGIIKSRDEIILKTQKHILDSYLNKINF